MTGRVLVSIALVALLFSFAKDRKRTLKALLMGYRSLLALVPSVLAMASLIGLILAVTPAGTIARLFSSQGAGSFILIAMLGSIITMPAPMAFPFAGSLLKLGATPPSLAVFITTLTMVGIVSAPLEIEHFGTRFTIARQVMSFVLALVIGVLMGVIL